MSVLFTRLRPAIHSSRLVRYARNQHSAALSNFLGIIRSNANRFQVYVSGNRDPYLNLSIEHYIYEKSAPQSTILLLYVNDPCVVIGRNQNPWLEANLETISQHKIPLIRRRSGGGTVFHDHGNVNFSVIYPPADFTRDKYAELVTRALRPYQPRTRVNERHDIVVDQGEMLEETLRPLEDDMYRSAYEASQSRKCSGSAYKLSRNRALHHGTCLINTKNLHLISKYLRSPLEPFVKARGVDSVKSPVTNVFDPNQSDPIISFIRSVIEVFSSTHQIDIPVKNLSDVPKTTTDIHSMNNNVAYGLLGQDLKNIEQIEKGMAELKSKTWLWGQTPRFDFSTYPTDEDERTRPTMPGGMPSTTKINFAARSGRLLSANMSMSPLIDIESDVLIGKDIHEFDTWRDVLSPRHASGKPSEVAKRQLSSLVSWLDSLFGKSLIQNR